MEIDLLKNYPRANRDTKMRNQHKSAEVQEIARRFGKEFFDGERQFGYGGFSYNARFWQPVIPDFVRHFTLTGQSSLLDIGCAKGFMLYDLVSMIPGIEIAGIDISSYAIENAKPEVKEQLQVACATKLPYDDNSFDVAVSINTVHNLEKNDCAKALQEIERVSRGKSFITVDAYRNDEEYERMMEWNLTAKTIMHVDEWQSFFYEVGYSGDYYWFIP